jgi:AcrR family transcriptional regulator
MLAMQKRRILAAARTLFLRQGFARTSTDAIANHAAISKATLYSHFENKAALFGASIVTECQRLSDDIDQSKLNEYDIRSPLLQVAHNFNSLLCSGDGLIVYHIVVAEAPRFPEVGELFYNSGPTIMINRIATILSWAADHGLLEICDPRIAANQFISLICGELHLTCVLGLNTTSRKPTDYIRGSVDFFLTGYCPSNKRE